MIVSKQTAPHKFVPLKAAKELQHRRRNFLAAWSRCSHTCPHNTWQARGRGEGAGRGVEGRRGGGGRVDRSAHAPCAQVAISKSSRAAAPPQSQIESLRGVSELRGLLDSTAAGFKSFFLIYNFFCNCLCRYRNASFVHGEEQEGAQLPPAPQPGGRL